MDLLFESCVRISTVAYIARYIKCDHVLDPEVRQISDSVSNYKNQQNNYKNYQFY